MFLHESNATTNVEQQTKSMPSNVILKLISFHSLRSISFKEFSELNRNHECFQKEKKNINHQIEHGNQTRRAKPFQSNQKPSFNIHCNNGSI